MNYPFEVWYENEQKFHFHWDKWKQYENELNEQYPVNSNHNRILIQLGFPSDRLEDVYVHDWNPHHEIGNTHLTVYDCFYDSTNWSTIFEVYPYYQNLMFFIEEGHDNPWGEQIRIMSTSSDISDPTAHRFAYFRGKYWKIMFFKEYFTLPLIYINYSSTFNWLENWVVYDWSMENYDWSMKKKQIQFKLNWYKEGF